MNGQSFKIFKTGRIHYFTAKKSLEAFTFENNPKRFASPLTGSLKFLLAICPNSPQVLKQVMLLRGVWHIGAPAPHCSPASLEPAPKLDKIGGNWPKLVQIGPNESYSVVSVFIAGWGRGWDLLGGGRGPRGGWWGRSPSSSSTSLTPHTKLRPGIARSHCANCNG